MYPRRRETEIRAKGIHRNYGDGKLVPDMGRSLLSIGQMMKIEEVNVKFTDENVFIKKMQRKIATGNETKKMFYLIHLKAEDESIYSIIMDRNDCECESTSQN